MTLSGCKTVSFWQEKRDTVVILVKGFTKMLSCQNKQRTRLAVLAFFNQRKGSDTSIKNTWATYNAYKEYN